MPASRIFEFDDPYSYQKAIRGYADVEVVPTTKGHFHAELMQIDLHRLCIQRSRERLPQITRASLEADRVAISFPIGTSGYRYRGTEILPGEIVVEDQDSAHYLSLAPCRWGDMSLTRADLAAAGRGGVGRELTAPSVAYNIRPASALMSRLLRLHQEVEHLAKTAPDKLAHPRVARSLEEALIHVMIGCLTEGTAIEVDSRARFHSVAISRFEEFLATSCGQPVYIGEICAATGVSESTLRRCCHEHLGIGPVHYLWLRRMHLARVSLMHADPTTTTVTSVATDYGFWELSRFSVEYRKLFGESPSASLRAPAQDLKSSLPLI